MASICPVFKWLGCPEFKWHLKTKSFGISFQPVEYQTSSVFRSPLYLECFEMDNSLNYPPAALAIGTCYNFVKYSNHLNTKHLIHLNTGQNGSLVFECQSQVAWRTIQIPNILDHKQAFSVRFSDHHLNTRPFENPTHIYHLSTRLVRYSDG